MVDRHTQTITHTLYIWTPKINIETDRKAGRYIQYITSQKTNRQKTNIEKTTIQKTNRQKTNRQIDRQTCRKTEDKRSCRHSGR